MSGPSFPGDYPPDYFEEPKLVYAVGFDGALSLGKYPRLGPPNKRLIEHLRYLMGRPYRDREWYVLRTQRSGYELEYALDWLKEQGIVFDSVNSVPPGIGRLPGKGRELYADLYVGNGAMSADMFCRLCETPVEALTDARK
jgi:hypothetical protein